MLSLFFLRVLRVLVQEKYGNVQNILEESSGGLGVSGDAGEPLVELVVTECLPMPKGQPLVKDWDCLRVRVDWNTHKSLHLYSTCVLVRLVVQVLLCSAVTICKA